jgi:hypothetical protein
MNDLDIERFYANNAHTEVDLLRARLGIPEPVPFKPKAQTPAATAPARIALIERPAFIVGMYVVVIVVMAFSAWSNA